MAVIRAGLGGVVVVVSIMTVAIMAVLRAAVLRVAVTMGSRRDFRRGVSMLGFVVIQDHMQPDGENPDVRRQPQGQNEDREQAWAG